MTNEEFNHLEIGTIVMCNRRGIYRITRPGVRCRVIEKNVDGITIRVEVINNIPHELSSYSVLSSYFDVIGLPKQIEENEVFSLLV